MSVEATWGGPERRRHASSRMNTATPNSRIALLAAARISRRRYPKVRRVLAGREPIQMASRARLIPAASVKTCAASASRARLWETRPPTISMARTESERPRTASRRVALARAADWT